MSGLLVRVLLGLLLLVALAAAACRLFLPERYAVNAPLAHMLLGRGRAAPPPDQVGALLAAPDGLAVELWASGLPNARFLRITPLGDVLVSLPRSGRVVLVERERDGRAGVVRTLLEGLDRPHGIDLHEGWLYVGETGAVVRVRFDPAQRRTEGPIERVVEGLPAGGNHWTRTVRFGPDGWMYVSVGSSCNVCIEDDPRRAAILRFRPDGSDGEIFATGLRNSVGLAWRPADGELYATDNGRDLLGDDLPPCELNRIVAGGFYGWPFAYGDRVPDPDLGAGRAAEIAGSIPPVHAFRAHNAPLGITFLESERWPASLRGAAVVALHGSWNRTRKDGYQVVSLHWATDGTIEERPFLSGFLRDEEVLGRPVDVAEGPAGELFVSDDYAGALYRVRVLAEGEAAPAAAAPAARPSAAPPASAPAVRLAPEAVARGRALYAAHACARCHDPERADPGVVPVRLDPDALRARHDVASLAAWLRAPTPPMPAVALDEPERRDLAAFLLAGASD
jgi:glucose/arabinose dehydrogenase